MSYTYDAYGRRASLIWPDAVEVTYSYDTANHLTGVYRWGGGLVQFGYDAQGRRFSTARANGATSYYSYDGLSRLSMLQQYVNAADDLIASYTYNPAGQLKSRAASTALYEPASKPSGAAGYGVDALNRLVSAGDPATAYGYDARGNLTTEGTSPSATTYGYDAENRLTSVTPPSGPATSLEYDAQGRLYKTVKNGVTTRFLYDGVNLIGEYDGSGNILRRYVHGAGTDEPMMFYEGGDANGNRRWLIANEQGSIIAITDNSGNVTAVNTYDEYGLPGGSNTGRFQYTGQTWIPEIGLYYYKARMYAPSLGRFMQTDPIGYEDGMNWYNYVDGDPVNKADPTGLRIVIVGDDTYRARVEEQMRRMREGKRGRAFLKKLEDSKRTVTIQDVEKKGDGNSTKAKGILTPYIGPYFGGSDATVYFDPTDMTGGLNDVGGNRRAPFVGLAHELGHAEQMMEGRDVIGSSDNKFGITNYRPRTEQNSLARENMVRQEHGMQLRTAYDKPAGATEKCTVNPYLRSCQMR